MSNAGTSNGRWWLIGSGSDIDAAWDDAKDVGLAAWGSMFSGAALYADDFAADVDAKPEALVRRSLSDSPAFSAAALAKASDWGQRKARVVLTDASIDVSGEVGDELVSTPALDAALREVLEQAQKGLAAGEHIADVRITGLRRRTKIVVTRNPAPSAKRYAVVVASEIRGLCDSMTEARALAKQLASLGPASVWTLGGRAGDLPLLEASEQIVAQKLSCALVICHQKKAEVNRTSAWLFSGPLEAPEKSTDQE